MKMYRRIKNFLFRLISPLQTHRSLPYKSYLKNSQILLLNCTLTFSWLEDDKSLVFSYPSFIQSIPKISEQLCNRVDLLSFRSTTLKWTLSKWSKTFSKEKLNVNKVLPQCDQNIISCLIVAVWALISKT